jgi:hypothetical protein
MDTRLDQDPESLAIWQDVIVTASMVLQCSPLPKDRHGMGCNGLVSTRF